MKPRSRKRDALGVIAIFAVIALVATVMFFVMRQPPAPTFMLSMPRIEEFVISDNGEMHIFGAALTLELETGASFDNAQLQGILQGAIQSMSYDEIISEDGMAILRQNIRERAEPQIEGEIVGIFLTQVLDGHSIPVADDTALTRLLELISGN